MTLLYDTGIFLYGLALRLAATWNAKARQWVEGRRHGRQKLAAELEPGAPLIWVHCSSAGEFEQGKPIIEALRSAYPRHRILVTFFSPSGYNAARGYPHAHHLAYLPEDRPGSARRFLDLVRPELVIFVKYDFWYHHLSQVASRRIPLLLVSAIFRPGQVFFRRGGGFFRRMLFFFQQLFVQDPASLELLREQGIAQARIAGDTRFDRVSAIAAAAASLPLVEGFLDGRPCLVAGSTWKEDEELLRRAAPYFREQGWKLLIAPHEIHEEHLHQIQELFPGSVRYSTLSANPKALEADVLLIDNIGLLSRLYRYARIAYIGGGFTRDGIHNTLEAAVYGLPLFFGPNYRKYREAHELIAAGGAFSVETAEALTNAASRLAADKEEWQRAAAAAKDYVKENRGATEAVLNYIQANRLLTN